MSFIAEKERGKESLIDSGMFDSAACAVMKRGIGEERKRCR